MAEWPLDEVNALYTHVRRMDDAANGLDVLATLRQVAAINHRLVRIATDVCEIGARETDLTQRAIAEALDVPASTLRGLRASVRANA